MKLIGGVLYDFDADELVGRIMKLPLKKAVKVSRMLQTLHPDWSFLKELANEFKQLDQKQKNEVSARLKKALQ